MKPEAPKSMQRRITAGSSLAETTTIGTLGYCARRYIRPEKPRTPGMVRSSRMRSTSPPRSSSLATLVERAGLGDLDALEQTGHRLAQRAAEQRVVVGNHQTIACRFGHSFGLPVDGIRANVAAST